jgi:hypothetical protein
MMATRSIRKTSHAARQQLFNACRFTARETSRGRGR